MISTLRVRVLKLKRGRYNVDLNDRKKRILQSVVETYIETGEPVGSKAIAFDFGLSSATVRSEMAELEELGYLEQPYTSAGRIPSHSGYRFYVDVLMKSYMLSMDEIKQVNSLLTRRLGELDKIIEDAGKMISALTNYTTVALSPRVKLGRIKRVDALMIDSRNMLIVLITSANIVHNRIFHSEVELSSETVNLVVVVLNENLCNLNIENINLPLIKSLEEKLSWIPGLAAFLVDFIYESLNGGENGKDVILEGTVNILMHPEFADVERAKQLLLFFDSKSELRKLLSGASDDVQIKIGVENSHFQMRDASLIVKSYSAGGEAVGAIGIVGPTRMNYAKIVSNIEYVTKKLSELLSKED